MVICLVKAIQSMGLDCFMSPKPTNCILLRRQSRCRYLSEILGFNPQNYKKSIIYTDFWEAYAKVIDTSKHSAVGKDSGKTNHVERWNNTLRQRIPRFVRKTLSFSKSFEMHELYLKLFIHNYNESFKY